MAVVLVEELPTLSDLHVGVTSITALYLGSTPIAAAYLGSTKVLG